MAQGAIDDAALLLTEIVTMRFAIRAPAARTSSLVRMSGNEQRLRVAVEDAGRGLDARASATRWCFTGCVSWIGSLRLGGCGRGFRPPTVMWFELPFLDRWNWGSIDPPSLGGEVGNLFGRRPTGDPGCRRST